MNSSTVDVGAGADDASTFSLIEKYTQALHQGERGDPEVWLRECDPGRPAGAEEVALLMGIALLFRHRNAIGLAPRATPGPITPLPSTEADDDLDTPESSTPKISDPSGPGESSIAQLLGDRAWLAAGRIQPLGMLGVAGGGMGYVALGWHTQMKREVVLKVAQRQGYEERFRREVRLHARLEGHKNIAVTRSPMEYRGSTVLVVDYVPGLNLGRWIQVFGPMPWRQALDCVRQAAEGLGHAHAMGIVHRDVKPSNLVRSDRDGVVKVIDWGLARDSGEVRLTLTGSPLGTPLYCPPEQTADARAATPASDLYGLGCVWYELLTGKPPFSGDAAQLVSAHRNQPPPALPAGLGVPEEVECVLRKMLAKEPADRFASVESFLATADAAARPTEPAVTRRALIGATAAAAAVAGWKFRPGSGTAGAPKFSNSWSS